MGATWILAFVLAFSGDDQPIAGLDASSASSKTSEDRSESGPVVPRKESVESGKNERGDITVSPPANDKANSKDSAAPKKEPTSGKPANDAVVEQSDLATLREETTKRLDTLTKADAKSTTTASKALREILEDRLKWLKEWDKAVKERQDAEHPEPSPEKLAADWTSDLERIKATLDQGAKNPDIFLPPGFRKPPTHVSDSVHSEMKEAIDTAQADLKDWTTKLELARTESARKENSPLATARATRDKTHLRVASLKARNKDREKTTADPKTPEARVNAKEKLVNDQWELRVETERLRGQEAFLTLQTKRKNLDDLNIQMLDAHVQVAKKTLDRMKSKYKALADREEHDLQQAAAKEQKKAEKTDDPLERYRAKRTAEILELEAKVLTNENALTTNPSPSFEEQLALADRAATDFTSVKHLLDDGKVSHLDALRLNNDFRRIGAERARIVANELATSAQRLAEAENTLSKVELELIYDSRDDRFELESLLEHLPPHRHPAAQATFDEFEKKHTLLLNKRRVALEKLALRCEQTHEQVERRLRILDDHFGFIRTNLFWIRDEEPVSTTTFWDAQREVRQLGRAGLRILAEVGDAKSWGRVSGEFLASCLALVILPWPLVRLRKSRRQTPVVASTDAVI